MSKLDRWEAIAAEHDLVRIKTRLGGRVRTGYPPSVGPVDLRLPDDASSLLHEYHLIGIVDGRVSFAIPFGLPRSVEEFPCGTRMLVGARALLDISDAPKLTVPAVSAERGVLRRAGAVYLIGICELACYNAQGHAWTSRVLFNGDLTSVTSEDRGLVCRGYLDWIEPGRRFEILLDPATGHVIGGDTEAVEVHA